MGVERAVAEKKNARRRVPANDLAIELQKNGDLPLFLQLQEQIVDRIALGDLVPGMRLPPVRGLAHQLGINQMTVAKAYKDLAHSGFVEGRRGGGTYVRIPNGAVAKRARRMADEANARPLLSERLYELAHAPGVISFTGNYPNVDPDLLEEFKECLSLTMKSDFASCFVYDAPAGRPTLRRQVAEYLQEHGLAIAADEVLITNGAQQGIDLVVRSLVSPGAYAIVERPAYYGALNALRAAQARIIEVPLEHDGMDIGVLEQVVARHRPRLIYINPTFQNPSGVTTSDAKRRAILALARRSNVAILEDDHSSELRFRGPAIPSLRALVEPDDQVHFVRGFGKVFLPGLRLGYVVVPSRGSRALLSLKARMDLHSNGLLQEAMALFLARKKYRPIFERMRRKFAAVQRTMIERLTVGMPPGTHVSSPAGGLSLWLELPEGSQVSELYFRAVRRGVAFVAGDVFYASHPNARTLRVSFGLTKDDELQEGVARLCSVANDLVSRRQGPSLVLT